MKRFLFLICCFIFCSAMGFKGVDITGCRVGYVPRILSLGDSITVGYYAETVGIYFVDGSYRKNLQDKIGVRVRDFVGQWGNKIGTETGSTPTLATRDEDTNYLLLPVHQPRHFGWGGQTIQDMAGYLQSMNQMNMWFDIQDDKNLVIILLGTNNSKDQYTGEPPNRIVDPSNIVGDVSDLIGIVNYIDSFDSSINVLVCQITPYKYPPNKPNYESVKYSNEWVILFNVELEQEVVALQASKNNLYLLDLYTPLEANDKWIDNTYSSTDFVHPSKAGYNIMGVIIHQFMIEKGLL
jgi:lysophospholipase L1-like esterase